MDIRIRTRRREFRITELHLATAVLFALAALVLLIGSLSRRGILLLGDTLAEIVPSYDILIAVNLGCLALGLLLIDLFVVRRHARRELSDLLIHLRNEDRQNGETGDASVALPGLAGERRVARGSAFRG